jgi:hypothetical protein
MRARPRTWIFTLDSWGLVLEQLMFFLRRLYCSEVASTTIHNNLYILYTFLTLPFVSAEKTYLYLSDLDEPNYKKLSLSTPRPNAKQSFFVILLVTFCRIPVRHFFSQSRRLLTKIFKSAETVNEKFRCSGTRGNKIGVMRSLSVSPLPPLP